MACFDSETATAYLRGDLEPEDAERWAAHLAECGTCRRVIQDVSSLIDGVREDLMYADTGLPAIDPQRVQRIVQKRVTGAPRVFRVNWPRPGWRGGTLVAGAAVILFLVVPRESPVSAAEALRRATIAEHASAAHVTAVVHRTLSVEERRAKAVVVRRQRVEIWHNAAERTKVRRLYDERGKLVAGEWTRGDGSRTLYYRERKPVIERADDPVSLDSENAWRWEPSAEGFSQAAASGVLSLERTHDDAFLLRADTRGHNLAGIVSAQLVLTRDDFRPVAQTFVFGNGADMREFALVEHRFETIAPDRVEPARFLPERELVPLERPELPPSAAIKPPAPPPPAPVPAVDPAQLDRLEMQAWYRLHGLGLALDRDAYVNRTSAKVYVHVTVSSDLRRTVVRQRLKPLETKGQLQADVRVRPESPPTNGVPILGWAGNPTYERLRNQALSTFAGELDAADAAAAADVVASETARWLLKESKEIHDRVEALSRFSEAWPSERLRNLDLDALAAWQTVVRDHATDAGHRAESLLERMEPFFSEIPEPPPATEAGQLNGPRDVERLVERVSALASRQADILSEALPTTFIDSRVQWREPAFAELRDLLTEIRAIAAKFVGPWPLGR